MLYLTIKALQSGIIVAAVSVIANATPAWADWSPRCRWSPSPA